MRNSLRARLSASASLLRERHQAQGRSRQRRMFFEALESRQLLAANATDDAGIVGENAVLTAVNPGATTSLLANDSGVGITVTNFGTRSAFGAAVNVNPDGTFNYNPAVSTALQALSTGQSVTDHFSYVISEGAAATGFDVRTYSSNQPNLAGVDAYLATNPTPAHTATVPVINFFQSDLVNQHFSGAGTASPWDDETPVPGLSAGDQDNYVVEALGQLYVPTAGRYTISVNSDDGFGLAITGGANLISTHGQTDGATTLGVNGRLVFSNGRGTTDTFGVYEFPAAGLYPIRLVNWEGAGGSSVEMFATLGDFSGRSFMVAQQLGAQWRLLGDTFDPAGLHVFTPSTAVDVGTVNVTVNGLNAAPLANLDTYRTGEDQLLTVPLVQEVPGMNVQVYRGTTSALASIDAKLLASEAPSHTGLIQLADVYGNGTLNFSVNNAVPGGAGDNYGVRLSGTLRVNTAGTYTFGTYTDDASVIRIDRNQDGIVARDGSENVVNQPGCCGNLFGAAVPLAAGDYEFEAVYTEGGGGDYGEFFYAPGTHTEINASFVLLGDPSGGISSFVTTRPGILTNDFDEEATGGNPGQTLTVTHLNGGGLIGVSALGAQVTLNADGTFTYNPNIPGSAVQALAGGQTATDSFTYTISDNLSGGALTANGTVNITVIGANDISTTTNNNYTINANATLNALDVDLSPRNGLGDSSPGNTADDGLFVNDTEIDTNDVIEVVSLQGVNLSGSLGTLGDGTRNITTALGASLTLNDNGTFVYDPTTSFTLQDLGTGQSLVDSFAYVATDNRRSFVPGPMLAESYSGGGGTLAGADAARLGTRAGIAQIPTIDIWGSDQLGRYSANLPVPGGLTDNYSVFVTGAFRVLTAGTYTFGSFTDDNSRLRIDRNQDQNLTNDGDFLIQGSCCGDVFASAIFAPGVYEFEFVYSEGGGGDYGELFYAPGVQAEFNSNFRVVGDSSQGIEAGQLIRNEFPLTFNITVNGLNDNPVVRDEDHYASSENATVNVTAFTIPGMNVQVYRGTDSTIGSMDNAIATIQPSHTGTALLADFNGNNSVHYSVDNPVPGGAGENYGVRLTGTLRVNNSGTYTFGTNTDDNSRIRIDLNRDGSIATDGSEDVANQNSCCGDVFGAPVPLERGFYDFEAVYTEGGGGDYGEFFYAPGSHTSFNASFVLIGDSSGGIASIRQAAGLLANDYDRDNSDAIAVDAGAVTSASGAAVTIASDGSFVYEPSESLTIQLMLDGQTLVDTFDYVVRDLHGGVTMGTATVTLSGISDPVADSYAVNEDNPGDGVDLTVPSGTGVLANDTLPGNPSLEVISAQGTVLNGTLGVAGDGSVTVATSAGGSVTIHDDGRFTYDQLGAFDSLPAGQNGTDTFVYTIGGPVGAPTTATASSAGTFPVATADLLTGLTPAVTGTALGGQEGTSANPEVLSNGQFGLAGLPNAVALSETVSIGNNTTLTYSLDTIASPAGYNIHQIHTYSGWRDAGRDNQDYTVQYATVANPGVFVDFTGAISFAPNPAASGQVSITSSTGFLATGVAQVRFVFGNQENGYVGYRELDVIGSPMNPTTATITVAGQNDTPVVVSGGPYNINAGEALNLNAAGTYDVDAGTNLTYRWDFDLDNVIDLTTTNPSPTVAWQALQSLPTPLGVGSHTIRLTVSDGLVDVITTTTLNISSNFVFSPTQDGVADGYTLVLNAAQDRIEVRDTTTSALLSSTPRAGITQLTFTGTADNDTLTVDFTNTTPIPVGGVTFNANGHTSVPGDSLVVRNGSATTVTHTFVNDHDGSVYIDGRTIHYMGLEPVTDNLDAANRVFTFTGGNESVALQDVVAGTSLRIDSTLGEVTTFNKPTDSLTINLATGSNDTLTISSATLTGNFTVNGSDGNDNVSVTGPVAVSAGSSLPGFVSIAGNALAFNGGSITTFSNVNLTAASNITTSGSAVDINAVTLTAAAATGIDLDTSVATLNATVSGTGNITLDEASAVTLADVTTVNGTIVVTTTGAGDVTAENVNSGAQNTSITIANGNLVSGIADVGVADIVANRLTLSLSSNLGRRIGASSASRLEINAVSLQANIVAGNNNSAWIVDTAGGLQMHDSSLAANGLTVFDLLVQNGSLTSVVGGAGDVRAIQVILAVTGASSTIGTSGAPLEINSAFGFTNARLNATTPGGVNNHIHIADVTDSLPVGTLNAGLADVFLTSAVGSIVDDVNDSILDITAGRIRLTAAAGGIGNTNGNLEIQTGQLEASATSAGIALANTGNLTIGGISAANGVNATSGDVVLSTTGTLLIDEQVNATAGNVSLTSNGMTFGGGAATSAAAGSVTLQGGTGAISSTSTAIDVVTQDLTATATTGIDLDTTIVNATLSNTGVGNVQLDESNALNLAGLNVATGSAVLNAGGSLSNGTGSTLSASGNASFSATSIALGNQAGDVVNFGSLTFAASAGGVLIEENSALDLLGASSATAAIVLTSVDALGAGQNLTIPAGASVQSTGSSVTLNAGDDALVTGNVTAATTVTVNVDEGNADVGVGGVLTITGVVTTPTVGGGAFLTGDVDDDVFNLAPQATTAFDVNGDLPFGTPTGDTLNLDIGAATAASLTLGGIGAGSWSFTPATLRSVVYTSIEDVNANAPYHLVLDATATAFGNTGIDDYLTLRRSGTDFVLERTGNLNLPDDAVGIVFTGDFATILSFTYLGSDDNDVLTISDVGGLVDFAGTVPGVTDNGNLAGTAEFLFDGGAGSDRLVFDLTGASAAQSYAIGTGAAAGLEGEVSSTSGGATLVSYFQDVELAQRTGVGATPGALTIIGDANANTFTTAANGALTRTSATGYTPFEFSGNNYTAITINALGGSDSLDLESLGTGQTNNPTITLDGGDGNDTIRAQSTSGNTGDLDLIGGSGNDVFELYSNANTVDGLAGPVDVDGTDGNAGGNLDRLVIIDSGDGSGDDVLIEAVDAATSEDYVITGLGPATSSVTFRSIDDLQYTGTSGNDTIDAQFVATTPLHDLNTVILAGFNGADQFLLFTSDQLGGTSPTPTPAPSGLSSITLLGGDGLDTFGETPTGLTDTGAMDVGLVVSDSTRMIRPSLSTAIVINGGPPSVALPTGDTIGDVLNLDISDLPDTLPVVVASGTVNIPGAPLAFAPLTWTDIEDLNLVDDGVLTNVQIGDLFGRMTDANDLVQFSRLNGVNQVRMRVNNWSGVYTVPGKTIVYGRGGIDHITQANLFNPAVFYGEDGNDVLTGASNNDWLVGGAGNDRISGAEGTNVLWGDVAPTSAVPEPQDVDGLNDGDDNLSAGLGNDVFYGGGGNDLVNAGGGNDYVHGGWGNDNLAGVAGDDRLYGGQGDDVLSGYLGNDLLSGGAGNDRLYGQTGNDVIIGGDGEDMLVGDTGNDLLITGIVANEHSTWSSLAPTSTFSAATYSDPGDNDAALLNLLLQWGSASNSSLLGSITHDGDDDDVAGYTGADDFCWEAADLLDQPGATTPSDFNAPSMGPDERFGPTF
jgi:VCBS repeat-containing protein